METEERDVGQSEELTGLKKYDEKLRTWGTKPIERKKIETADAEAKLDSFVETLKQPHTRRRVVVGSLFALSALIVGGTQFVDGQRRDTIAATVTERETLQKKLNELDTSLQRLESQSPINNIVDDAQKAAIGVVKVQNAYLTGSSDNAVDNAKAMDTYLAPGDNGKPNAARVAWFVAPANTQKTVTGQEPYLWGVASVMPNADGTTANILWTLKHNGVVIAWSRGVYSASTQKISKISYGKLVTQTSVAPVTVENQDHAPSVTSDNAVPTVEGDGN